MDTFISNQKTRKEKRRKKSYAAIDPKKKLCGKESVQVVGTFFLLNSTKIVFPYSIDFQSAAISQTFFGSVCSVFYRIDFHSHPVSPDGGVFAGVDGFAVDALYLLPCEVELLSRCRGFCESDLVSGVVVVDQCFVIVAVECLHM